MGSFGSTTSVRARQMRRVLARWQRSGLTLRGIGSRRHPHQMPAVQDDLHNRCCPWNVRRRWHFGEHHRVLRGCAVPLLIAGMPEDPPPPAQSAQRDSAFLTKLECAGAGTRPPLIHL